jgi:hypothetical protein
MQSYTNLCKYFLMHASLKMVGVTNLSHFHLCPTSARILLTITDEYPIFRAYSFSGTHDSGQQLTPSSTHLAVDVLEQRFPLPSLNEEVSQASPAFMRHSPQLDTKLHYPSSPTCSFLGTSSVSPSHWISSTSVLLSPAPSSLGSSQEELNVGDTARLTTHLYPWPSPVWHCFQPGQ